jgi:excisionase family DNA binding protein
LTRQRITVSEAAELLGISQDAVRMRVKRGKLEGDKEGNRLFVWIDTDQTADQTTDRDDLLEAYRDQVEFLRRELERRDQLLAAALSRIPEIEAPQEPTGAPETVSEGPDRGQPQDAPKGTPRSWWRRIFVA